MASTNTVTKIVPLAGRSYKVGINGAEDLSTRYLVTLSAPLGIDEAPTSFVVPGAGGARVPAIGTAHPNRPGYYVIGYDVTQPEGSAKSTLQVTCRYGVRSTATDTPSGGGSSVTYSITEWGWDDGTGEKELVSSVGNSPRAVVNSAGDPFDSVPTVYTPAPTFTKVMRFPTRQSYSSYLCKVNDTQLTIGGMTCAAGTLLCMVAERQLIGEAVMPYEYTIRLRYRSNKVLVGGSGSTPGQLTEIGWDAAIVDAGMREIDATTGKKKLIQVISAETGEPATVTAPALLNGSGSALQGGSGSTVEPVVLHFQAYERASFPSWFYAAPALPVNT